MHINIIKEGLITLLCFKKKKSTQGILIKGFYELIIKDGHASYGTFHAYEIYGVNLIIATFKNHLFTIPNLDTGK